MNFTQSCSGKSVGAIIKRGRKILLIDRKNFPLGWAAPAGHLNKGESPEQALAREVNEETGYRVRKLKLILHQNKAKNKCKFGTLYHDWWVFKCDCRGKLKIDPTEAKRYGWFPPSQIKKLKLEPIWRKWFKILKLI